MIDLRIAGFKPDDVTQARFNIAVDPMIESMVVWDSDGALIYPPLPLHVSEEAIVADLPRLNGLRSGATSPVWEVVSASIPSLYRCELSRCLRIDRFALADALGVEPGDLDSVINPRPRLIRGAWIGLLCLLALMAMLSIRLWRASRPHGHEDPDQFQFGPVVICPGLMQVVDTSGVRGLTQRDVVLLKHFHARPKFVLSKDELYDVGWGRDYMPNSRALDQHITTLRRKLDPTRSAEDIIETVHGQGYRFSG